MSHFNDFSVVSGAKFQLILQSKNTVLFFLQLHVEVFHLHQHVVMTPLHCMKVLKFTSLE